MTLGLSHLTLDDNSTVLLLLLLFPTSDHGPALIRRIRQLALLPPFGHNYDLDWTGSLSTINFGFSAPWP